MDNVISKSKLRLSGILLAVTPLIFIALVVGGLLVLAPNKIGLFDNITPEQMETIKAGWIIFHIINGLAIGVGALGLILLNNLLRLNNDKLLVWVPIASALAAIIIIIAYVALRSSLINFTEAQLSLVPNYPLTGTLSVFSMYMALVATAFTGFNLYTTRLLRRVGLATMVLSGIHLVIIILAPNSVPPFVVSFWWLAMGIGLLRRNTPAT
jgi:hypothetical protein